LGRFLEVFRPIAKFIPEVEPPKKRVSLSEKFFWTGIVLAVYLIMCEVPLYGIEAPMGVDPFYYLRIIFASRRGTLMELGIGPIVTAGLVLQILAGSKIIDVDFSDPDDRALFTCASKVLSIVMTGAQAASYIIAGVYGKLTPRLGVIVFAQLMAAGVVLMLMDELIQKGWGLGSGISLFIAAGVAQNIMWSCFSPFGPLKDGMRLGVIVAFFEALWKHQPLSPLVNREGYPDLIGLGTTVGVLLAIIYVEGLRVEIPISYARFRGFRSRMPIKLLYVSNIPVILASALFADIYWVSNLIWSKFNRDNSNFWLNLLAQFDPDEGRPIGGLVKYITAPIGLQNVVQDPVRAAVYAVLMVLLCVAFSVVWIEVGGMSPSDVADQLIDAGMQVPGFRRARRPLEMLFKRYIPTLTIIGGAIVGLIAVVSDFLGVFGTGIGILLMVDILYQYYQILVGEQISEMYPTLAKVLGA